jgi:hypothetical protein
MFFRLMLAMCALFAWGEAAAQESNPAGRWALRSGDRTLMILELAPVAGAGAQWEGSIRRPKGFQLSPGAVPVLMISEPQLISQKVRAQRGETGVILRSTDATGEVTQWRFTVAGERARMELADLPPGVGPAPLRLARTGGQEQVSTDLEAGSRFVLGADLPSNAELKSIFEADQADRQSGPNIDWAVVRPRDEARRARTAALLDAGALQSGDDFWHAAFIFQHGSNPDDYLLAHSLAVIAAARGRPDATWIAAATLDRYLQNIGRKQIYGTQYSTPRGGATTQEPYDRTLVSDALRAALGVPPQAEQERRRTETERMMREAEAAAPRP